jgi:hypothetical protein
MARKTRNPPGQGGLREFDRTGQLDHRESRFVADKTQAASIDWSASFFSVHDGRECLGHVLVGRKSFCAIDADDNELGDYPTRDLARRAVVDAARRAAA